MDIKLPGHIIDAETMLSFSTSHKLHHKKIIHQRITFAGPHSKTSRLLHDFFSI